MKKYLYSLIVFFAINNVFAAGFLKDGIYSFDYERVLLSVDAVEMYKQHGINARQDVSKVATGAAVLVEDSSFIDPETGLILKVNSGGKISSPDNNSIQGSCRHNGRISFFGTYTENNQTIQIALEGTLIFSEDSTRAGKVFSGEYHATDPGSGRNQIIWIDNGMYFWKYEDATEDDFSGWPMIVNENGEFNYLSEYTTRAIMYGLSETCVSTKTNTIGKFEPDGSLKLRILTVNSGTGQMEAEVPVIYSAIKATEISNSGNNQVYVAMQKKGNKSKRSKNAVVFGADKKEGTVPEWFSEMMEVKDDYVIACGKKQSYNSETAVQLASAIALNQVISYFGSEIRSSVNAGSVRTETENKKYFYATLENLSLKNIPFEVLNQSFNSESQFAYVKIKVKNDF